MICYMAKREADGFLDYRWISTKPVDVSGSGWSLVQVEVRELDEKRKRLEDAAGDLLEACKDALDCLEDPNSAKPKYTMETLKTAITKAEGKE